MAHVLNRQDRNYAFWKFLFFFLLSTAMIVAAVYFDVKHIPAKDNELLKTQVFRFRNQEIAQERFVKSMDDARRMIDSLSLPGVNLILLKSDIKDKIRELSNLQYNDSSMYSRLNRNVHDMYLGYFETSSKIIDMGDLPQQLRDAKSHNEELQRDIDRLRSELSVCQKNNAAPGF